MSMNNEKSKDISIPLFDVSESLQVQVTIKSWMPDSDVCDPAGTANSNRLRWKMKPVKLGQGLYWQSSKGASCS
jgi:hypothetical protein